MERVCEMLALTVSGFVDVLPTMIHTGTGWRATQQGWHWYGPLIRLIGAFSIVSCYVFPHLSSVFFFLLLKVLKRLQNKYGSLYRRDNVILSGSHTHSGPGGYFQYTVFVIASEGFSNRTFEYMVTGIVKVGKGPQMELFFPLLTSVQVWFGWYGDSSYWIFLWVVLAPTALCPRQPRSSGLRSTDWLRGDSFLQVDSCGCPKGQ